MSIFDDVDNKILWKSFEHTIFEIIKEGASNRPKTAAPISQKIEVKI